MSEPSQEPPKWCKLISFIPTLKSVGVNKDILKVGRAEVCDVILTESMFGSFRNAISSISKEHFIISKIPGTLRPLLEDTSKNGTYINGIRVPKGEKVLLKNNDKISMGQRKLFVYGFELILNEDLPDTLTPLGTLEVTPKYTEVLPVWGRLISRLMYLDSYDIHKDAFKVGRSQLCDVSIEQTNLKRDHKIIFSKEHFLICRDSDKNIAYIKDLSKTGTFLNHTLIGKDHMQILQNDDVISVGGKLQVFQYRCMYAHDAHFLPVELKGSYEPSTVLGRGGAGEVRLAYEKLTCQMVAIKKVMKSRNTSSQRFQLNHPSKIKMEINILLDLNQIGHPSIIKMKDIVETAEDVFIVLEYMQGGELTNRILSHRPMTESNVKFFFYQIVLAVNFLHNNNITHRDLKPENILLYSDEVETLLKLSDFGLSKVTDEDDVMRTMCGTMAYIAPEILNRSVLEYNRQVDIWSLGVVLFYMLGKKLPFKSADKSLLERNIMTGNYTFDASWKEISPCAKDLVQKMLTVDPEKRISVAEILQHKWISNDPGVRYKVGALYDAHRVTPDEEIIITYNMEPPSKRIRTSSEESSTSSTRKTYENKTF